MHVFFQPNLTTHQILLSEEESKHCIRVLRLQKGDTVYLADGLGVEAKAVIIDDNPKRCLLAVESRTSHPNANKVHLHVAIAPTKSADRIEWFIEKATEAGIAEITFLETTNSERAKINLERCKKVAISAMKQSKQWWLPKINALIRLPEFLSSGIAQATPAHLQYMAWCEHPNTQTLPAALQNHMPLEKTVVTVLIGPEGDFTPQEMSMAKQAHFEPVSLGESILRTETAGLYVCMAVKALTSLNR